MLRSMTGFGRARQVGRLGHIVVDVQSVNRRHLDVKVLLPKELNHFEHDVIEWVSRAVSRGHITVRVSWIYGDLLPVGIQPNIPLVRQVRKAALQIAKEGGGLDENQLTLELLTHLQGVINLEKGEEEESAWKEALKQAVQAAIIPFLTSKDNEGKVLALELESRLLRIESLVLEIEKSVPFSVEKQRDKLKAKLADLLPEMEHDERILREICLYAEKVDIAEEISRLQAHTMQFREVMKQAGGVGKNLEFVLQEMGREANTMGSKTADIAIIQAVVAIKGEIEKMKEQVQNVE